MLRSTGRRFTKTLAVIKTIAVVHNFKRFTSSRTFQPNSSRYLLRYAIYSAMGFGSALASYAIYLKAFTNTYPDRAKDHLRRALVGQSINDAFETIEWEYKQAIKACIDYGMLEKSDEVVGIYERLAEFCLEREKHEKATELFLYIWHLLNEKTAESAKLENRKMAIISRLADSVQAIDMDQCLQIHEYIIQTLIGLSPPSESVVNGLRGLFGSEFASWFQTTAPNRDSPTQAQIISAKQFKPVEWASLQQVIASVDTYSSLIAQHKDKTLAITLLNKCIRLVHDEFINKGKDVPKDIHMSVSIICSKISNLFIDLGKLKEASYWAKEALEHAKLLDDKLNICRCRINYGKVLEMQGLSTESTGQLLNAKHMAKMMNLEAFVTECDDSLDRMNFKSG